MKNLIFGILGKIEKCSHDYILLARRFSICRHHTAHFLRHSSICRHLHIFFFTALILLSPNTIQPVDENSGEPQEMMDSSENRFQKKRKKWSAEISGFYYDKNEIKVQIYRNEKNVDAIFSKIKSEILSKEKLPILQKDTDSIIGEMRVEEVHLEDFHNHKKVLELEVLIRGKIFLEQPYWKKLVGKDAYIAYYALEDAYTEPLRFFPETKTGPKKMIIHPVDRKEMLFVEMGPVLHGQGTDATKDDFNPYFYKPALKYVKDLPSFYMDKYEVTNKEYNRFLMETGTKAPKHWIRGKYEKGKEHHPVINLAYTEVQAYATWSGKRIPTEFEWEKAARGAGVRIFQNRDETLRFETDTISYPFGTEFDSILCNTKESQIGDTVSIFDLAESGKSPYGMMGMCGNASEWTSSSYELYEGHFLNSYSFGKKFKVIRGGSFASSRKEATVSFRSYGGIPNLREDAKAGFRLVIDYKP